jgi:hypothetical protein
MIALKEHNVVTTLYTIFLYSSPCNFFLRCDDVVMVMLVVVAAAVAMLFFVFVFLCLCLCLSLCL